MSLVVTSYKLKYEGKVVGYRVGFSGLYYDMDIPLYKELTKSFSERKADIVPELGRDIEMFIVDGYLSSKEDTALEVSSLRDLALAFAVFGIELYKIRVIDCNTNETVIRTNDKKEAKIAIKNWQENNQDCLIAVYEDGECVYP